VTWTPVPGASVSLTMPGTLLAGLAVTSHNGGAMGSATFDTATLTNTVGVVTSGATYIPLTPTRLLDTRNGTGLAVPSARTWLGRSRSAVAPYRPMRRP